MEITEKKSEESKNSSNDQEESDNSQSDSDSMSSGSSMGLDGEDENTLYQKMLLQQTQQKEENEARKKGQHLDDLVDKEMIELLNICKRLHCPKLEAIQHKMVEFGPADPNKRLLILDMDETMIQAKFLVSQEDEKNDDGDFIFELQSEDSGSKDIEGKRSLKVSIKMRPYLDMALEYLAKLYEICVFTAGT
jgi:TFIIF-interacting CTD phosphatase-like protein